jgi:hypothetical protein
VARAIEPQTIKEACESVVNYAQSSAKSVCSNKADTSYPTLLCSERNLNSRATSLETDFDQPDSSWNAVVANSDSVLLEEGDNVNEEIAANHNASQHVAVARSKLSALSNSDPNLFCSWEIGSASLRSLRGCVSLAKLCLCQAVPLIWCHRMKMARIEKRMGLLWSI